MFKKRLIIDAIIKFIIINLDLPAILIKLMEMKEIVEKRPTKERILKAEEATRYSSPNKIFIIAPGKRKIKMNNGRLRINIHFPTCLLNSLIRRMFFLAYSLVIKGKNNLTNNSEVTPNREIKGIAAL